MGKATKKYGLGQRGGKAFEVDLPSGETCLMRKIGPDDLIELGVIDDFDSLTGIVQTEHIDRVAGRTAKPDIAQTIAGLDPSTPEGQKAVLDIIKDKDRWEKLIRFVNMVVSRAVLDPPVYDREEAQENPAKHHAPPDAVAVQDVDLADRMVIMSRALQQVQEGVLAAEPFRQGRQDDVADLPDGEGVRHETEQAPGGDSPAGS